MSITITPADVGRTVRLRNGETAQITNYSKGTASDFVVYANDDWYTSCGTKIKGLVSFDDIIAFADEPVNRYDDPEFAKTLEKVVRGAKDEVAKKYDYMPLSDEPEVKQDKSETYYTSTTKPVGSLIQGTRFPTDQHKQVWLQTYIALLPKYTTVGHAAAAASAAVEAFKKFERGE